MRYLGQVKSQLLTVVIGALIIYSFYWVIKICSYKFFYEGMVRHSITEMVKPEALKKGK